MNKYRLVIIDDHADVLELLHYNLTREDYEVKDFLNPVDALQYITRENTDLVITDWMLPEMDGLELCKQLKRSPSTRAIPVMMVTGRNDEIDVVSALELGAEEYIVKPFRILELLTRVKKVLGRQHNERKDVITRGGLTIDLPAYKAYINGVLLDLTIAEFRLLELLSRQPGKVFSRSQIMEQINGANYFADKRAIDVQVVGLRKKMGSYKGALETVRSVGYRFNETVMSDFK
jgi:DNA-binding response OmpR family regulator